MTMAFPLPEEGFLDPTNWWMEEVEKRSDGRLDITPYYNESLVPASETLSAIREGRVTGGWISNAYYPNEMPLYQVAGLPYETYDGPAQAQALQKLLDENEDFRAEFDDAGLHLAYFVAYGPTVVATKEPVESVEDPAGKRFRAAGPFASVLKELGADAVFLDAGEIFSAVERGVIDGVGGFPFDTAVDLGLAEAVPQITDIGYGHYASSSIGVSKAFYDGLPADLQQVIDEVSAELVAEKNVEFVTELEKSRCERLLELGGEVNVWDGADRAQVKESIGDQYVAAYKNTVVKAGHDQVTADDFYDAFHAAYDEFAAESGYESSLNQCGSSS